MEILINLCDVNQSELKDEDDNEQAIVRTFLIDLLKSKGLTLKVDEYNEDYIYIIVNSKDVIERYNKIMGYKRK